MLHVGSPQTVTPYLLHQMRLGALDLSSLPAALAGQLRSIAARMQRQANRAARREHHARNHYVTARNGGGERECARRMRQIAAGSLRVENELFAGAWTDAQFGKVAVL